MLNIVVINCDNKYIEYEWDSIADFVNDMGSNNEIIPMLDDALAEVNTQDEDIQSWWEGDGFSVYELLDKCKQIK